jgi:hypothetical protein
MQKNSLPASFLGLLAYLVQPAALLAQDRSAIRDGARQSAAILRAVGEPKDRCSLGVQFENKRVVEVFGQTNLQVGDRFLEVGGKEGEALTDEGIVSILRTTQPDAQIEVKVDRFGANLQINVKCQNSKPYYEDTLPLLDLVAKGRWDECRTKGSQSQFDHLDLLRLRAICTEFSRGDQTVEKARIAYQVLRSTILATSRLPDKQKALVETLRGSETTINAGLGNARYLELVALVKAWPGGTSLWASTEPDWDKIKISVEQSLRSTLVDPDSGKFEWTHGFVLGQWRPAFREPIEGYWTCGRVNARNRMGGFTGFGSFVVVVGPNGGIRFSQMDNGPNDNWVELACSNSTRFLPPPTQLIRATVPVESGSAPSIAGEIERLVRLRDSGALTDAEFNAAKSKLLGSTNGLN